MALLGLVESRQESRCSRLVSDKQAHLLRVPHDQVKPDEGTRTAAKDICWLSRERRQQSVGIVAVHLHAHGCLGVIEPAAAEPPAVVGDNGILVGDPCEATTTATASGDHE